MLVRMAETYGPIYLITGPGESGYHVSDAASCKRILTDKAFAKPEFFQNITVGLLPNALFAMPTNATWFRHRKLLQPAFGPMHLKNVAVISSKKVKETIEYWLSKEVDSLITVNNIKDDLSLTTLDILTMVSFGEDYGSIKARDSGQRPSTARISDDVTVFVTKVD